MKKYLSPFFLIFGLTIALYLPVLANTSLFLDRGNDLTEFFWPIYFYTKQSILATGQLPFWNTMFLSGTPLLPDPQAPIFYLPNAIFLLMPISTGFIVSSIIHTTLGGIGAYLVAKKSFDFTPWSSVFVGFAYILSARFAGFIEAGHFGLIAATAWIPFVLLAVTFLTKDASLKWSVLLAISLAGLFYTHPTTFVYSAIFSTIVFLTILVTSKSRKQFTKPLVFFALGALITFGLTAITLLPQLEWVPQTNRYLLASDKDVYPKWLSIKEFITAIVAPWISGIDNVQHLNSEKWLLVGITPLALAVIGFLKINKKLKVVITGFTLTILIVSANNASFFYEILLRQNWYVFGRVSTRIWFTISLMVVFLAGYTVDQLIKNGRVKIAKILSVIAIIELLTLSWIHISKPIVNDRQIATKSVIEFLTQDDERFRVFCTTRCFSQKDVAKYGLETVGGYSTLHQKNYYEYAWSMTGVYWNYYTLALPPIGAYKFGELDPNFTSLGEYNTKYVMSPHELDDPYAIFVAKIDDYNIYKNKAFRPRAYFAGDGNTYTEAKVTHYTPNEIVIDVSSAPTNQIVISEVYNPGWVAYADGTEIKVQETPIALRAVDIPEGTEEVSLKYEPTSFKYGLVITITTILLIFIYFTYKSKKKN